MSYVLHDPFGKSEEVHTLMRALEICANFAEVAALGLTEIEEACSTESRIFPVFDEIAKHWDDNAAVIRRMESDPAVQLAEAKAKYRTIAQDILEMAQAISGELPSLPE